MFPQSEDRVNLRRVPDFYNGKSIFITGAAGYLGVIILETLLRACPGICSIYILLREKKGIQPECRKDAIFKRKIFYKLKERQPDVFKKVHVVAGDVTLPNLGMSQADLLKLIEEVSVVFHCAASISFLKPLKFMVLQNSKATYNVIEFSRKLKRIDALVYTSTAYSNSNRQRKIEEIIYRLPFPSQRFLDELDNGNNDNLNALMDMCKPSWPNHYTFSKCLSENIILDYASDLPVAIVRPSIILCSWKGILPGYIEEGSGMVDLGIAVGKGFVRAIPGDPNTKIDLIPVDIVANTHIVTAWSVATGRSSTPLVINCVAGELLQPTLQEYHDTLFNMAVNNPLPRSFQRPSSSIQKNKFIYAIIVLFEHYIPALVIDMLLRLSGRKPRMLSLYRFYDSAVSALNFFLTNSWNFQIDRFKSLAQQLDPKDEEMLYVDTSEYRVSSVSEVLPIGSPFYEWDIDRKPMTERNRITFIRYLFTSFIKTIVLAGVFFLFYIIISKVLQNTTIF
ncbi:fatty acyl-CoA reductase 1 [Parasteatoda tepidariorum]|uniref:fatty acyl-CoA reductase 1 n=1 Tax=Parasteatoda tepidariorum TaxID=114398 RepID=UPI00077FDEB9|nr:fatty acyl-CoA reductase 1 [Parasteatoda tepidariorum]